MDVHIEIIRAEVKGISNCELQCQTEAKNVDVMKKSATLNLQAQNTWPKLSYQFKRACPSAIFLFSIIDMEPVDMESSSTESLTEKPPEPKTIAKCIFPFAFSIPNSKQLQHLASEVALRSKQVQVAYLTSKIKGADMTKVIGRLWFKVVCPKAVPKLKSKVTWMDLDMIRDHLASPEKPLLPSLPELQELEDDFSTLDTFPSDSPKLLLVFHSVNTYLKTPNLTPTAKLGTELIPRENSLFESTDGSKNLYMHPILKAVNLVSKQSEHYLELYLADNDLVIFSAVHPLQMLLPFKQYNWEYNWRWMAGTGGLSPLHKTSGIEEPTMTASVKLAPAASQYPRYEGLEFVVYGMELESSVQNDDVVLSVQFGDLASKSRSQTAASTLNTKIAPFMSNNDITSSKMSLDDDTPQDTSMSVVKNSNKSEISPAYFFYPIHPFFRSKGKGVRLTLQLYAPSTKHARRLWWQASKVARAQIDIPNTMSSVLTSQENSKGVYWELNSTEISQSDAESVAYKVFGVIRWKSPKMEFLTSDIGAQLGSLRKFSDLTPVNGIQPGLLTSILSDQLRGELERESKPESITDYKAAVKKMGIDILHLREQNSVLRRDNKKLEEHLMQLESSVILSAADQAGLSILTKADLIHKILEQSQRLSTEIAARQASQEKVKSLQNILIEKNELEAKFVQIQSAHSAQQKLVRDLQLKYEKYRRCAEICKQQEEVIVQLDSLLEKSAQNDKVKEGMAFLSKENARLRKTLRQNQDLSSAPRPNHLQEATITALRTDVSRLRSKCADLESQLEDCRRGQSKGLHEQTKVFEANQKVKIAAAREKTLVRELEDNARIWAQDKAQYEVQLAEYRAKVQTLEEELARCHAQATIGLRSSVPNTTTPDAQSISSQPHQLTRTHTHSRASESSRNPWQTQSRADTERRQPLMSVSRQLHPYSRNSIRTHPQSVFEDSLDPRLSF